MATVDIGTTTTVSWTNAAASAALTVTAPDGTTTTPTVTTASGKHTAPVPTVQAGRHLLSWQAPAVTPTTKFVDILDVWPADPRFLISMEDAAAALRWRPADVAARADDLRLYNAAATEVIEDIAGAVLVRTVEQTADGGDAVLLWHLPSEITSVTVDGVAATGWIADMSAAVVYAGDGVRFPSGRQNVTVTYTVGGADIPPSVRAAVRILLRHMTTVDQAPAAIGTNPVNPESTPESWTPSGFMVPRRVLELVENRHTLPGIA